VLEYRRTDVPKVINKNAVLGAIGINPLIKLVNIIKPNVQPSIPTIPVPKVKKLKSLMNKIDLVEGLFLL